MWRRKGNRRSRRKRSRRSGRRRRARRRSRRRGRRRSRSRMRQEEERKSGVGEVGVGMCGWVRDGGDEGGKGTELRGWAGRGCRLGWG